LTGSSGGRCRGIIATPGWIELTLFDEFIVTYTTGEVEPVGGPGFDVVGLFESDIDEFITGVELLSVSRE
jgi:hypothetical protein